MAETPERLMVGTSPDGYPVRQMKDGRRFELRPKGAREIDSVDSPSSNDISPRGTLEALGSRTMAMNLTANPAAARAYFESIGYETKEYGKGWNFAYRKRGSDDSYQPLDPKGLDVGDFFDIISDVLIGVGSGTAGLLAAGSTIPTGPGALVAGMAAGGAAAAGLEAGKQGLGSMLGVPDNFDPGAVAMSGVAGAGGELLGAAGGVAVRAGARGVRRMLEKTARGVPEFAAKLIGVEGVGNISIEEAKRLGVNLTKAQIALGEPAPLTAGQVMMAGARLTNRATVPLTTPERAGDYLRAALRYIERKRIPEVRAVDDVIQAASEQEVKADLSVAMREIEQHTLQQIGTKMAGRESLTRTVTRTEAERTATALGGSVERKGATTDLLDENAFGETEAVPFHKLTETERLARASGKQTTEASRTTATRRETQVPVFATPEESELRVARGVAPRLPQTAKTAIDEIREAVGYGGPWDQVPIRTAHEIKQILQDRAYGKGATALSAPSDLVKGMYRSAAARTRAAEIASLRPLEPNIRLLLRTAEKSARDFKAWTAALHLGDKTMVGRKAGGDTVKSLFGEGGTAYIDGLNALEKRFMGGPNAYRGELIQRVLAKAREAEIGRSIGVRGLGEPVPILTAGGGFRGISLIGGGAILGGPAGALAGGLLGSGRVMMRHTAPLASAASNAAIDTMARLSKMSLGGSKRVVATGTLTTAQIAALRATIAAEGGGSKGVARADEKKGRKLVFVGGS